MSPRRCLVGRGCLGRVARRGGATLELRLGAAKGLLYFAAPVALVLWGWWLLAERLPEWFGITCPGCSALLIGDKGEPLLGPAEETKECPECGTRIAQ